MLYVGIDISKYKHDCFITNETAEVIRENFSFSNTTEGFAELHKILSSLSPVKDVLIGLEATGHYGNNLKLFLKNNDYIFQEFNPVLIKKYITSTSLRKTKTDKADAIIIAQYLMSVTSNSNSLNFDVNQSLKSLCRDRERLIKTRSKEKVAITNLLDLGFPEFKEFFNNNLSATAVFILNKYGFANKIKNMKDYESIKNVSRGKFTYAKFIKLKELAKNTIGTSNELLAIQLKLHLDLLQNLNKHISTLDDQIEIIIKELNPAILSIPGIGISSCAVIISEYRNIKDFKSADTMLAFAGLEPSTIQSGTLEFKGRMVKRGSGYLRYTLMNSSMTILRYIPTFYDFYNKKRSEGKSHRVALTHVCKKLIRLIYTLETTGQQFDSSKLR